MLFCIGPILRLHKYAERSPFDGLIDGYNSIDNRIVWGVVEEDLDDLIQDVTRLLKEKGAAEE
jgi:uncharacterized protein with HEPN domain